MTYGEFLEGIRTLAALEIAISRFLGNLRESRSPVLDMKPSPLPGS
jgi:hypothetical protein